MNYHNISVEYMLDFSNQGCNPVHKSQFVLLIYHRNLMPFGILIHSMQSILIPIPAVLCHRYDINDINTNSIEWPSSSVHTGSSCNHFRKSRLNAHLTSAIQKLTHGNSDPTNMSFKMLNCLFG